MTKAELVSMIAEKTSFSKKDSEKALSAVIESISSALVAGEKIQLGGFGTFEVRNRAERKGINPRTQEEITIPASKVPAFKPSKVLKDALAK